MCEDDRSPAPGAPVELDDAVLSRSFRVGAMTITQLSDGVTEAPRRTWFTGIDPKEWMPVLGLSDPDALFRVNFGGFLLTGDDHVTLVDCGLGAFAHETPNLTGGGELLRRLSEAGLEPGDVDQVVQTHLHADHCGHLVDDDGALTFPNATVYVHEDELAYWTSEAAEANFVPEFTRSRITPVAEAGRLATFGGERPLSDAVTILPTPGHTPGHCAVQISSDQEHALLLGDVVHHTVHLEHHRWLQNLDVAPPTSIATRQAVCERAARLGAVLTAPHMPILTLGTVAQLAGGGFTYEPVQAA